jgi:DNA polymerase I-like protein with 3'-5' exonuclease and polymerase domains
MLHGFDTCSLEECYEYLDSLDEIALDCETTGLHYWYNKPILLGLGDSINQYIFDLRSIDKSIVRGLLTELSDKLFVAHNMKFDRGMLKIFLGIPLYNIFCTMVANEVVFNGLPVRNGLDACLQNLLTVIVDKSQRVGFINKPDNVAFSRGEILYLQQDIEHLLPLKKSYNPFIEKFGMQFLIDLEMKFLPVLSDIELTGQKLDVDKWRTLANDNKKKLIELEAKLKKELVAVHYNMEESILSHSIITDMKTVAIQGNLFEQVNTNIATHHAEELNISSPMQLKKIYLRAKIKIDGTGDEVLNNFLKTDSKHPLAEFTRILLEIRKVNKATTTYGEKFLNYINKATGRIHSQFTQTKTDTGRLSSGDIKDGKGKKANAFVNFQNIPRSNDYRKCFIAEKGYEIVTCDLSAAEMVIAADKSKDEALVGVVTRGEDLHSRMANVSYNIVLEELGYIPGYSEEHTTPIVISSTQHKQLRTNQKTINFAIIYGAGPKRIADVMNIPYKVAMKVHKGIQQEMPGLMKYQETVKSLVKKQLYIEANGRDRRRKWFKGRLAEDWYKVDKEACNMPIQSTNASMVKEAIIIIDKYIKLKYPDDAKVLILNTVHDECVVQVPKGDVETAEQIKKIMIDTANLYLEDLKMGAEYELCPTWVK